MAPMGCHAIPGHVTGLYIFAVINLTLLLNITFTDANILVVSKHILHYIIIVCSH